MLLVDDASLCVAANPTACALFSRGLEDTLGQRLEDLLDGVSLRLITSTTSDIAPGRHLHIFASAFPDPTTRSDGDRDGARDLLSAREREVLELLAGGADNNEVATTLGISPETVRNHTRNARRKLGARSRSHAIALAIALGQLELTLDS